MPARPRASARKAAGVVRLADATGSSTESWQAAVEDAVRSIRKEVPAPLGVEISRQWADLERGRLTTYRVSVRVAYRQDVKGPATGR